jgi:hypothetical protein
MHDPPKYKVLHLPHVLSLNEEILIGIALNSTITVRLLVQRVAIGATATMECGGKAKYMYLATERS